MTQTQLCHCYNQLLQSTYSKSKVDRHKWPPLSQLGPSTYPCIVCGILSDSFSTPILNNLKSPIYTATQVALALSATLPSPRPLGSGRYALPKCLRTAEEKCFRHDMAVDPFMRRYSSTVFPEHPYASIRSSAVHSCMMFSSTQPVQSFFPERMSQMFLALPQCGWRFCGWCKICAETFRGCKSAAWQSSPRPVVLQNSLGYTPYLQIFQVWTHPFEPDLPWPPSGSRAVPQSYWWRHPHRLQIRYPPNLWVWSSARVLLCTRMDLVLLGRHSNISVTNLKTSLASKRGTQIW